MNTLLVLLSGLTLRGLTLAADQIPEDDDVVAGWLGAMVFVLLIAAVALLGRSLAVHLRRAQRAKDAGVFGDDPPAASGDTGGARR